MKQLTTAVGPTLGLIVAGLLLGSAPRWLAGPALAAGPPPIRSVSGNAMPACVTPARLMAFLKARNTRLEPKFEEIAEQYRRHGEAYRVRWDYAFFQMLLETNYLQFRRANGDRGDVHPKQNNFAGLGATGGGVPGDSYPDVSTGVRAQIEHLVAYSGELLPNPVGSRTRLKQKDIVSASRRLRRAVTFADLTRRWAADRNYARSIESVAQRFRDGYCTGNAETAARARAPAPAPPPPPTAPSTRLSTMATGAAAAGLGLRPEARRDADRERSCRILAASYGGNKTVVIRARTQGEVALTLLTVLDGFEAAQTRSYLAEHAPNGSAIATFPTREAALAHARTLCSS